MTPSITPKGTTTAPNSSVRRSVQRQLKDANRS